MLSRISSGAILFGYSAFSIVACPTVTVADPKGVVAGKYPQPYEISKFHTAG